MLGTYAAAALICAASLIVGRALLQISGHRRWRWLEPAVGFGAILAVAGLLARAPGHGTTATVGIVVLVGAALVPALASRGRWGRALRLGLPLVIVVVAVLSIPFAVSGRWGLLGVGFNNDLGLHLAWAEWLRSGFGPKPDPGYPLGPHGVAVAVAALPGIGLGQAFVGEIIAIGVLTALSASAPLAGLGPVRRVVGATLVTVCYLAASFFAQGAFKETAEALFVLTLAAALHLIDRRRAAGEPLARPPGAAPVRFALPFVALAAGVFFAYSFAGLAWPVAIAALWSLTVPRVRRALAPRTLLRTLFRPGVVAALAAVAAVAAVGIWVGPFGFGHGFNKVAGSNTYGPVSPIEAIGIWPTDNYRLIAAGGPHLTGLFAAIAGLGLAAGLIWWLWRGEPALPIALGATAALYAISLPFSGDYSKAKALMIAAPLAMLIAIRPLLVALGSGAGRTAAVGAAGADEIGPVTAAPPLRAAWVAFAVVFIAAAAYSSFLVLRDAPVGPPGHGAELRAFLPILRGKSVLFAGQDRYAAYELLGADTHVPLVEFPDPAVVQNPEKPFDTGDAYSPIDFDSFSRGTLDRFRYVITGRAAWNSQAPPNFRQIAATPSFVLWERTGPTPAGVHVLLEGTQAAAHANCAAPETRILLANPGRASLFPSPAIGPKTSWGAGSTLTTGEATSQTLSLGPGRWSLSLQYFSPFGLTLTAPGFHEPLVAALDGQRPNTISLGNDGQFWPAGQIVSRGGPTTFTIAAAQPSALQRLSGYDGRAYVGELVAVPDRPHRVVPLAAACNGWVDWYQSPAAP